MNPIITYHENEQRTEVWKNEDRALHRLDGPAVQVWNNNEQLSREGWYINGQLHRLDGPAYRAWYGDGRLWFEEWYINDIQYETEAEFQVAVDLYKANEIAELF